MSCASVRRRRPSSSSSVRPSVPSVPSVRPSSSPTCKSKAACKFSKKKRRNRCREYEIRIELEIWKSIAGGKLLCVLKKLVLWTKPFCFRFLVPMSILTLFHYHSIDCFFGLYFVVLEYVSCSLCF